MKATFVFLLVAFAAWGQPAPAPGGPARQAPPALPDIADDTVIATFEDGGKMTFGDFRKIYAILPPDNQEQALRDRKMFFHQWALMRGLGQIAEKNKLDEQSPTREALIFNRMLLMSQAQITESVRNITVEPPEIVSYYDANKDKYKLVRVKVIYISYNNNPAGLPAGGKKPLTEAEAGAKAAKLGADIRAGADFVKLAKEHSDDEASRNKDGDFATMRQADNIPDAIKSAVFALKQGELTEPIRQPNGFYIFRAEEVTVRSLSQVREEIYSFLKDKASNEWMAKLNSDVKVTYNSSEFFGTGTPAKQ